MISVVYSRCMVVWYQQTEMKCFKIECGKCWALNSNDVDQIFYDLRLHLVICSSNTNIITISNNIYRSLITFDMSHTHLIRNVRQLTVSCLFTFQMYIYVGSICLFAYSWCAMSDAIKKIKFTESFPKISLDKNRYFIH